MARRLSRRSLAQYAASEFASGANHKKVVKQLAAYLIESRRTDELELLVRDVYYLLAERGIVVGSVISAADLTAETRRAIESFIKSQTKASQVALAAHIDPSVIGGVKVNLPGRVLDQTVARKLTILRTRFKKV